MMIKQDIKLKTGDGSSPKIQFRHFIRHPLCLPLTYKVLESPRNEDGKEMGAQTINVSMGGLLFPARQSLKPGSRILIKMPFEDKVVHIQAIVIRSVYNAETSHYDIAVRFPESQEAFKVRMIEQLYLIAQYRDLLSLQEGTYVSLEEASRKWIKLYSERFGKIYW